MTETIEVHMTVFFKTQSEFKPWAQDAGLEITEVLFIDASGDPVYPVRVCFRGKVVNADLWIMSGSV